MSPTTWRSWRLGSAKECLPGTCDHGLSANGLADVTEPVRRRPVTAAMEPSRAECLGQSRAAEMRHALNVQAAVLPEPVDRDDIGMIQPGERARCGAGEGGYLEDDRLTGRGGWLGREDAGMAGHRANRLVRSLGVQ